MKIRHCMFVLLTSGLLAAGSQALAADQPEQNEQKRVPSMLTGKKSDAKKDQAQQAPEKSAAQTGNTEAGKKKCLNKRGQKVDC